MLYFSACREQPIFTTKAHVFQIDPSTKKKWLPASTQAVNVSYYYDSTRNSHRIISVEGSKVKTFISISSLVILWTPPKTSKMARERDYSPTALLFGWFFDSTNVFGWIHVTESSDYVQRMLSLPVRSYLTSRQHFLPKSLA